MPVWVQVVVGWVAERCLRWLIFAVGGTCVALHVVWFFTHWGQYVWFRVSGADERVPTHPRWIRRSIGVCWKAVVCVIVVAVASFLLVRVAVWSRLARIGTMGIQTVELSFDDRRIMVSGNEALRLYRWITESSPVMAHHSGRESGLRLTFNGRADYEYELSLDSAVPTELWLDDVSYPGCARGFEARHFDSAELAEFVRRTLASKPDHPGEGDHPE
jgi:hypothetical protein